MTPEETAKRAFVRFVNHLSYEFYELWPTDSIEDLLLSQVEQMFCFFNVVDRKPKPYMYVCHIHGRWFVSEVGSSECREVGYMWDEAFRKATPSVGYAELINKPTGWEITGVI